MKRAAQGDLFTAVEGPSPKAASPTPAWRAPASSAPEPQPKPTVLTVGELTRQLKSTLERGFARVMVRGEVSGYRGPNVRGHLYFSLKDADACLDARIWRSAAERLKFKLKDGMAVVVEGSIDLYEPAGRYSLIVTRIEPAGVGALALAFEQLKERLAAEGLFGPKRVRPVRPIPFLPRRIGVVTSITGAALRDFLRVLHARHPHLPVLVCDARVQGSGADREVARAIEWLAATDVDVIVVTRGGGSIEDLWTFNEEAVARAIHSCPVPVVTAIGHEVDTTIADFVADFRAPTPSAAAEKLAPVLEELLLSLATSKLRLRKGAERAVLERRQKVSVLLARLPDPRRELSRHRLHLSEQAEDAGRALRRRLVELAAHHRALADRLQRARPEARLARAREAHFHHREQLVRCARELIERERRRLHEARVTLMATSPRALLSDERRRVESRRQKLEALGHRLLAEARHTLSQRAGKLHALSPLAVMARGYALAFGEDGHVVRQVGDVQVGERITVRLASEPIATMDEADVLEATVSAKRKGRLV
ncbi:MAG: exodeoxyribonuclease VII large subunit [Myxococcota bacterium]